MVHFIPMGWIFYLAGWLFCLPIANIVVVTIISFYNQLINIFNVLGIRAMCDKTEFFDQSEFLFRKENYNK